jgi:DNA mismatch repair protein MutL
VREALAKTGAVSFMDFDEEKSVEIPVRRRDDGQMKMPAATINHSYNPFSVSGGEPSGAGASDFRQRYDTGLDDLDRESAISRFDESVLEFIEDPGEDGQGQLVCEDENAVGFKGALPLAGRYVATSRGGDLVVIDLRRAKEAIIYERYVMMLGNDSSASQRLLFPEVMVFSNDDVALLRENADDFAAFGFEYRILDDNNMELQGIPADFPLEDIHDLLYDMIDCRREQVPEDGRRRLDRLAGVLARNGARRLAKNFTEGEIAAILEALAEGGRYNYTPDGRKVMMRLQTDEIRKMFL